VLLFREPNPRLRVDGDDAVPPRVRIKTHRSGRADPREPRRERACLASLDTRATKYTGLEAYNLKNRGPPSPSPRKCR